MDVVAIVTNPDKPTGRKGLLLPSPVKEAATRHGIPVLQPARVKEPSFTAELEAWSPDLAVVVAYGKILPPEVLAVPQLGFVNLHFSLLPAYRGAAPVQRALMAGETVTGVSVMVLTEGMDEGPVLARVATDVHGDETAGELGERLAILGAGVLPEVLFRYAAREIEPQPQDHSQATYAPKIGIDEARIDWTASSEQVRNLVRGTNPEPGAWTTLRGERIKVFRADPAEHPRLAPGEIRSTRDALIAGTGTQPLSILEGQRAGGRKMTGGELGRGLRVAAADRFE